jgi:hypothetical protein
MDRRLFIAAAVAGASLVPLVARADQPPQTWDGLVMVKSEKLAAVYLQPGANFSVYDKVMLDTPEVAFRKNWQQDYNDQVVDLDHRVTDDDAQRIMTAVRTGFAAILADAFAKGGFPVVTSPAKDVLRVSTAIINLCLTAPDVAVNFSDIYADNAGQATLVLEARDSLTGALLGRALDAEVAGDSVWQLRNSVTNHADFRRLGETWANASVSGLQRLRADQSLAPPARTPTAAAASGAAQPAVNR